MPARRSVDRSATRPGARRTGRRRAAAARAARAAGPARERPGAPAGSPRSRRDTRRRIRLRGFAVWRRRARSIGLFDEDERGPLHDGRAGADERHVDVLDLALAGPPRGLQGALDDVPEAVDAPGAQTSAERVERQLTIELDASVLDEVERFTLLAEPVRFEAVDHRRREAVVDLRDVHVLWREARALPGQARGALPDFHVARKAADAPGHLERQPLAVAGDVGGPRAQIASTVAGGQHDGDRALHRDVAVVEAERVGDHARIQIVLAREGLPAEVRVRVLVRVPALGHRQGRHLLPALAVPLEP